MKLSELKSILSGVSLVEFAFPNGIPVPSHFHVTEVGLVERKFIDCGGTFRNDRVIHFQLWTASDYDHRLSAEKLNSIIELSEKGLGLGDYEIEVEYQGDTIGRYRLGFEDGVFMLEALHTDCLAKDNCGVPEVTSAPVGGGCCSPSSGCC